jgi:Xaa-Pro aminopeptidase
MMQDSTIAQTPPVRRPAEDVRTLLGERSGVSLAELSRRWALVRNYLKERNIDALIAVSGESNLSGTIRWLTDAPSGAYRVTVAFHADDLMTVVEHGAAGQVRALDGNDPGHLGVGEVINVVQFASAAYTQACEAEALVASLKRRGYRSIALVNADAMPSGFVKTLLEGLGDAVAVHDATPFIDRAKAIKSPEEIEILQDAAAIQDSILETAKILVRPGMRNFDVVGRVLGEVYQRGASNGFGVNNGVVLFGSGKAGKEPAIFAGPIAGDRQIGEGDAMTLLIECASPAGYIIELGRNLVFGKAAPVQLELQEKLIEAQAATCRLLTAGTRPSDVFAAHNEVMIGFGLQAEQRLYAHGQGYDMIERPLIREDEDLPLENGMCLAVHPGGVLGGYFGFVCDNFLIDPAGARRLHTSSQAIIEL